MQAILGLLVLAVGIGLRAQVTTSKIGHAAITVPPSDYVYCADIGPAGWCRLWAPLEKPHPLTIEWTGNITESKLPRGCEPENHVHREGIICGYRDCLKYEAGLRSDGILTWRKIK